MAGSSCKTKKLKDGGPAKKGNPFAKKHEGKESTAYEMAEEKAMKGKAKGNPFAKKKKK